MQLILLSILFAAGFSALSNWATVRRQQRRQRIGNAYINKCFEAAREREGQAN